MNGADDYDRTRGALWTLDAGCDRDTWVRIGMAAKAAGLSEDDFVEWSRQGANYGGEPSTRGVWRSIKPSGGVGAGTLFDAASRAGWRDPRKANGHVPPRPPVTNGAARPASQAPTASEKMPGVDVQALWDSYASAPESHGYIRAKGGVAEGLRVVPDDARLTISGHSMAAWLAVPYRSIADGTLRTVQFVPPSEAEGRKLNLSGAPFADSAFITGSVAPDGRLYVCEGIATAWACVRADYHAAAVVTAGVGRFLTVAKALHARWPDAQIVLMPDRGQEATAEKVAHEVRGAWVPMPDDALPNYDAGDYAAAHGDEALADLLAKPRQPETEPPCDADASGDGEPGGVLLTRAADVTPERVEWLWPGFLPLGKLSVLAGCAGVGKTTIAMHFAAVVSCAGSWPDGCACREPGNVLIWSGEDDAADTLVPRLLAAGADLASVRFIDGTVDADGRLQPFDPASDIPRLAQRIAALGGAHLLIIDPIVSAVSGDAHKANDVRRNLQPLVDLAASYHCAVLGISHFSKGSRGNAPVERVIGSQAFGALARMVLVAAHDDASERHVFARAKSNIAPDTGGFSYALEQVDCVAYEASRIAWGEWLDGNARDLLGDVEQDGDDKTEFDEATVMLADLLADGPVMASRLAWDAQGAGYSWKTMQRAARKLGVEKRKVSMSGGWQWALAKGTCAEGDTKNPGLSIVSPSGDRVPFGSGRSLRSAPLDGSPEGDIAGSVDSSEPGV
ncbi:topoisomerase [Paraburkholderia guartelaensis]|uniref:Topoisomerase n=1 Tax=Paraburkholderia guartelaensis TaxID=2546446 RepID=A0A4R5L0W8_9BURK|nr:AAA family ATPase [Paraburkholderia guartelaensis]TDG02092.1 topoisomerase [Paraburkholderia guartelaensis]